MLQSEMGGPSQFDPTALPSDPPPGYEARQKEHKAKQEAAAAALRRKQLFEQGIAAVAIALVIKMLIK